MSSAQGSFFALSAQSKRKLIPQGPCLPVPMLHASIRTRSAGLHGGAGCARRPMHTGSRGISELLSAKGILRTGCNQICRVARIATTAESHCARIHPSAIVHPAARLGDGVRIGPFSVVGRDASLGDRVELHSHVIVSGYTTIGADSTVFSHATVGAAPQEPLSWLVAILRYCIAASARARGFNFNVTCNFPHLVSPCGRMQLRTAWLLHMLCA